MTHFLTNLVGPNYLHDNDHGFTVNEHNIKNKKP